LLPDLTLRDIEVDFDCAPQSAPDHVGKLTPKNAERLQIPNMKKERLQIPSTKKEDYKYLT